MMLNKSFKTLQNNMGREPYIAVTSISMLTITFLTLNLFIFSIVFSHFVLRYLENKAQVSVFFTDKMPESAILTLKSKLEQDPRILGIAYVSKAEALKRFTFMSRNEPALLESVQSNPLPASLEIKAKDIKDLPALADEFGKLENVDNIRFYKDVVNTFRRWSDTLRLVSFILLFVLSLVSILVVLMTIGITINSKGVEVEILKLVGASDKYVKGPLILQGVFYGVVAVLIATILFYVLIPVILPFLSSLVRGVSIPGLNLLTFSVILLVELLFGAALGYVGSTLAIRKYLKY